MNESFNRAVIQKVHSTLAEIQDRPGYKYPWNGLEQVLVSSDKPHLLFGYGSLMDPRSAARTFKSEQLRRPAVAFGVERVFNYSMSHRALDRYGAVHDAKAIAALNAYRTNDPAQVINGVVVGIAVSDIAALREREIGYDLHSVAALWWDELASMPFVVHILCAPDSPTSGPRYTDDMLLPQPDYFELVRGAAESISPDFLDFFLDSTWLADRRRTAREWERNRD